MIQELLSQKIRVVRLDFEFAQPISLIIIGGVFLISIIIAVFGS